MFVTALCERGPRNMPASLVGCGYLRYKDIAHEVLATMPTPDGTQLGQTRLVRKPGEPVNFFFT